MERIGMIKCDGEECTASTAAQVALRGVSVGHQRDSAAGWYFVKVGDAWSNYCPSCGHRHLEVLHSGIGGHTAT